MELSENGENLIKSFEGLRLTAYYDTSGKVWTIGWGHTGDVVEGETITESQAQEYFDADVDAVEYQLNVLIENYNFDFNQNQYDALVSFGFNAGTGNLRKVCRNPDTNIAYSIDEIALNMSKYVYSGGVYNAGLYARRQIEIEYYNTPSDDTPTVNDNTEIGYAANVDANGSLTTRLIELSQARKNRAVNNAQWVILHGRTK